jgi:hypothetical protein
MNITRVNETDPDSGMTTSGYFDWDAYEFSFIPSFIPAQIDLQNSGPKDSVYQMKLKSQADQFNGFYGAEPYKLTPSR